MTELTERQHHDLRSWVGESHLMRLVCAASALEETVNDLPWVGVSLESGWWERKSAVVPEPLSHPQALPRMGSMKLSKDVLDAFVAAVRSHADTVAAQLEVTPDQLYSMTFADFIARHEGSERPPEKRKSLVERLNEAYDEDAEREDEEFFRTTKAYYRRRFHAED